MDAGKLPRLDVWISFSDYLLTGINWGLMAVLLTPKALQKCYQDLYYNILPLLGVNRNIVKEWKTLPERYHGLGLLDFKVYALSKKVHILQQKWDGNNSTSKITGATYETSMIEVGIYGNIFSRSWGEFKILATKHTWCYNLWELCHRLDVKLEIDEKKS